MQSQTPTLEIQETGDVQIGDVRVFWKPEDKGYTATVVDDWAVLINNGPKMLLRMQPCRTNFH